MTAILPRLCRSPKPPEAGQRCLEHQYDLALSCSSMENALRERQRHHVEQNDGAVRSLFRPGSPRREIQDRAVATYDEDKAKRLFALFVENTTWHCPTLTVQRNLARIDDPAIRGNPNIKYAPFFLRSSLAPAADVPDEVLVARKRSWRFNQRMLAEMHRAGVPLLAGTDCLNPYCFPGSSLHTELELMVQCGLSPAAALQTATIQPARFMGREKVFGAIAVGKHADVVLLRANPLDDIRATRAIEAVVIRGRLITREEIASRLKDLEQ